MIDLVARTALGRSAAYASRWLGSARRRFLLVPIMAWLLTAAETLVLLVAAQILLGFIDGNETLDLKVSGLESIDFYQGCAVALALIAATAALRYAYSRYSAWLGAIAVRRARHSMLDAALHTPWELQRSHRLGELQRLLATNGNAAAVPVISLTVFLSAGSAIAVYFAIVAITSPSLLVVVGGIIIGLLLLFAPLKRALKARSRKHTEAIAKLQLDATSYSALKRDIELYAVQDESFEHLQRTNGALSRAFRDQMFLLRLVPPLYQLALMAGIIAAVAFARASDLTVAGVGTAALLLFRSLAYVQQLNTTVQNTISVLPLLDEIDAYVAEGSTARRSFGTATIERVETIELRDVSFTYDGETPAVAGIDLTLRAGDRVGIVGRSGGGKSTVANLLVRLADATSGVVLVNGRPIADYEAKGWAREIGYVGQDALLLRGSVEENVRLFRPASDDAVTTALDKANLLTDAQALPEGLQTAVGEGSNSLSGGQRQRLAIARALLDEPSMLVLDEPSSALDAVSEQQIHATLTELDPTAIVVIIAHRPLLLEHCTRILHVEDGMLTEDRPAEPMRAS